MKKLIALLAVCGFALAFVACGKKAETAVEETAPVATEEVVDSAASEMDTTTVSVDTTGVQ